jgi:hypothetical protein
MPKKNKLGLYDLETLPLNITKAEDMGMLQWDDVMDEVARLAT